MSVAERWNFGLRLSILNAAVFAALSLALYVLEIRDITYPTIVEGIFTAGSLACFMVLLRNGGELAAFAFFEVAAGFYFGFGTLYSTVLYPVWFDTIFSLDDQWRLINKINLVNAFSVTIVLIVASMICRRRASDTSTVDGIDQVGILVAPLRRPLLLISLPIVLVLFWLSFPEPENPVWRSAILLLQAITYSAVLLCGMQWSKLPAGEKAVALGLVVSISLTGLFTLSKLMTLIPIGALLAGLMLDSRLSTRLLIGAGVSVLLSFIALYVLVNGSRVNYAYRLSNTFGERVVIISDTLSLATTAVTSSAQGSADTLQLAFNAFTRFGDAPIQGFLISNYDAGNAGNSLDYIWQILVPRALWPDKPNISDQGLDLDAQMSGRKTMTFLGPTYDAEAYWNGGWLDVILISILLGCEIGWFTRKWNRFRTEGLSQVGALIFAVPILANMALLEGWVAITYVGIAVGLAGAVEIGDRFGPFLVALMAGRAKPGPIAALPATEP